MMAINNNFMVEYARLKARLIEEIELSFAQQDDELLDEERANEKRP